MTKFVLIVDDEEPIAWALAAIVEDAGYEVRMEPHGRAALVAISARLPDLVLTDLMMPQMNGAELIKALRAAGHATLPVVLLSAAGLDAIQRQGADAVIAKPFDISEIEEVLERFLVAP